jgi:hypothetical protein
MVAVAAAAESSGGKLGAWFGGDRVSAAVASRRNFSYWRWEKTKTAGGGRGGKRPRWKQRGENEPYEAGRDVTGDAINVILTLQKSHFQPSTVDNGLGKWDRYVLCG